MAFEELLQYVKIKVAQTSANEEKREPRELLDY